MWRLLLTSIMLSGLSPAAHGEVQSAEDWAWEQIRTGKVADFDAQCGELDPKTDAGWGDACRRISSQFLQDVLTDPARQTREPRHRVRLRGAGIIGFVDLATADFDQEVWIDSSRFEGGLSLDGSHWLRDLIW
jgi:hypothetical protein